MWSVGHVTQRIWGLWWLRPKEAEETGSSSSSLDRKKWGKQRVWHFYSAKCIVSKLPVFDTLVLLDGQRFFNVPSHAGAVGLCLSRCLAQRNPWWTDPPPASSVKPAGTAALEGPESYGIHMQKLCFIVNLLHRITPGSLKTICSPQTLFLGFRVSERFTLWRREQKSWAQTSHFIFCISIYVESQMSSSHW